MTNQRPVNISAIKVVVIPAKCLETLGTELLVGHHYNVHAHKPSKRTIRGHSPEEVHDEREHRHHLEEEEHLGSHREHVKLVEVIEKVLKYKTC